MLPLSVVILAKNEEANIVRCLQPLQGLSDDILVVDNGSTDKTCALAESQGARVIQETWQGYAKTKNAGNARAKYDWILSLDADEVLHPSLIASLQELFQQTPSPDRAFLLRRILVYGDQVIRHGSVCREYRLRLFNRQVASWNQNDVHEDIVFNQPVVREKLHGYMWHYSYRDARDHMAKLSHYARLSATQMHRQGRKPTWAKIYLSPIFGFLKNYILRRGFLDGRLGLQFAKEEMQYTRMKYALLKQRISEAGKPGIS